MSTKYLRDQRGVAMLLELVLVAAVLALAGLAVYQANHRQAADLQNTPSSPTTAVGLAASAAAITEQESGNDVALTAEDEAAVDEMSQADNDVSDLGGTSNESF
jgi:hypothetical protein